MDNQLKHLGAGIGTAIAIAVFVRFFSISGMDSNFWLLIMALVSAGMMYLVFNIFMVTKRLVPAIDAAPGSGNNKKP